MAPEADRIAQVWPEWRTEELIGRGGFGSVWRASRTVAGHTSTSAVKIIDVPGDASDVKDLRSMGMDDASIRDYYGQAARSLVSEIAAMDSLRGSANVVHIEDYQLREQQDGPGWAVFIRMELLESLEAILEKVGLPDQWETARIGSQVCNALARCHAAGIIHRDVKPANIFRNRFGDYKLGDFGIARNLDSVTRSTMSFAGTRPFMAPEVESGHYDASVDTYSLGVMLYRWLNGGRPPFVGPDEVPTQAVLVRAQARRLAGERPPLPAGRGVDPKLAAVVRSACEPEPTDRWASAAEFGRALQSWLDEHPAPTNMTTESPTIGTASIVSTDSSTVGAAVPPSAAVPSVQPQDPTALTVDFKAWLGNEVGKPKPEPVSPPVSHSAMNAWSNARNSQPGSSPIPHTASDKAEASKPQTRKTVPTTSSAPPQAVHEPPRDERAAERTRRPPKPQTARQLTEEDALRGVFVIAIIAALYYVSNELLAVVDVQQGYKEVFTSVLLSGTAVFAFSIWAFHSLKSTDSVLQKALIVIASGFLGYCCMYKPVYPDGQIYFDIRLTFFYLTAFVGPVGNFINYIVKKLGKTKSTSSSESPKASAAKLAQTAGLLAEEEALRRAFTISIVIAILEAAYVICTDYAWAQQSGEMLELLTRGLYGGSRIFLFSVWALLALESADSMWRKVLTVIAAGYLAFLRSPEFLYAVTLDNAIDFIWYFINFAGPVGSLINAGPVSSLINYITKKLKKK